ncbi:hyaluronan/mRNA binding family protein [Cavenderia fasciculata]|uniref:Hyaluronan/mRNA binding family protein n=1 Tax=Cavenderia fasciculata TaxID=261658 RepID=F4PGM3_CACFS|nr:hyaluronan/mRNA binding family protein [Cavenderia fasciculata]EGG24857.1 hyaluronan/mRNA binding family protein [Cavenderia fasciculata]|eukprot:XP_004362708.1 hyaluronan/mRNA binding family protein [Cavenderia fasciculata]
MSKVNNLFDLLQDDDDEQQPKLEVSKPAAVVAPKEVKKPAEKAPKADKPVANKTSPKLSGEKKPFNKDDKPRRPRPEGQQGQVSSEDFAKRDSKRDSKHEPRKPRTDSNGQIRGRQFDRQSGTGRPINGQDKKGGSGRGNWGKATEQALPADVEATATADSTVASTDAAATTTDATEVVDTTPKEIKLTLSEYQKQQEKENVQQDGQKLRQAGEGETTGQWDDFVQVNTKVVKTATKTVAKEEKKPKKQFINLEPSKTSASSSNNKNANNKTGGAKKEARGVPTKDDFPALTKA